MTVVRLVGIDIDFIQAELDRRKPGQSKITTQRNESDQVEFLSGIFEGKTQGTPIGFVIRNKDQHSNDYNDLKDVFRPHMLIIRTFKNMEPATTGRRSFFCS